jgi:cytochrome P450
MTTFAQTQLPSCSALIPSPPPTRIFGWRGDLAKFFLDPIGVMEKLKARHGRIVSLSGSNNDWICAFGHEYNESLLTQPETFQMDPIPIRLRADSPLRRLKTAIVYVDGSPHKRQRRLMGPLFHNGLSSNLP